MELIARGIVIFLFVVMTAFFVYVFVSFDSAKDSDLNTIILTGIIFFVVIFGIILMSYFATRRKGIGRFINHF